MASLTGLPLELLDCILRTILVGNIHVMDLVKVLR